MRAIWKNNSLSIVLFGLFFLCLIGQYIAGFYTHNEEQRQHRSPEATFAGYAVEGHFLEAVFENWESEFLQIAAFVVLTAFLFQKGSAESKPIDKKERVDEIKPGSASNSKMPWPVRQGGFALTLYSYSLSIAILLLFVISFVLHGMGGVKYYNQEQAEHGAPAVTTLEYMSTSTFWFESFQNWQSEFLSIAVMVVFTIFLRQIGSPESKPVDTPHGETGT
ncbi:MAG TPA: DUF6766 family protein [Pyrinomonadaceae bacterium]|jgi:hypothetical protein|nr:DUF6766 family protein [Pyrinomonadaceae bacterium]